MNIMIQGAPMMLRVAWWWPSNRMTLTFRDGFDVSFRRGLSIRNTYFAPRVRPAD